MAKSPPAAPAAPVQPTPTTRACGTMPVHERLLRTDPAYARARIASENHHFEFRLRRGMGARTGVTRIPVVVHVVFKTAAQNIADSQVQSQIEVLTNDFRKRNADLNRIPAAFQPLSGDARVEFALATTDPAGNASNGITRTQTNVNAFSDDDAVKHAASGGADAWPPGQYLNMWVCQLGGGLLGYAQFPGGAADTDGVVVLHSAFGTNGTAAAPFNLGRTATHEVGHWLNLRHIWGDDGGGCNGDDFVTDTPNQADANTGKPAFPLISCHNGPNGDMFMNYMDYTDDDSMFMFSAGQVERMQACLDGDRAGLGTQVAGTSPFLDTALATDVATLKFSEDSPPTLAANDLGTLKFREDQPPVTLKFRDDAPPTVKFREDVQTFTKFRDDVKSPLSDKPPISDTATLAGNDLQPIGPGPVIDPTPFAVNPAFGGNFGGGGFGGGGFGGRGGVPFVLSTPHHSMAWTQSFPQAAQAEMQALAQQIGELESLLMQYAQAEQAGQLGDVDRAQADQLYRTYEAMMTEYQRYSGV
ncbi:zinc metalloprotease [Rivibacter subsaxonicus]|uniref:Pregnancy-associated plasma protein-A n=1 Tax=Rivibacter subsaxonicus TaxID=457575 RepID=A0A4V2FU46_9BURK|nr:zinc metalloprotease [Rivibacter subsaxonicus]RZU00636.1 pregnancy-associated plasma protein-A [Rivibacter subsaxonicus]